MRQSRQPAKKPCDNGRHVHGTQASDHTIVPTCKTYPCQETDSLYRIQQGSGRGWQQPDTGGRRIDQNIRSSRYRQGKASSSVDERLQVKVLLRNDTYFTFVHTVSVPFPTPKATLIAVRAASVRHSWEGSPSPARFGRGRPGRREREGTAWLLPDWRIPEQARGPTL